MFQTTNQMVSKFFSQCKCQLYFVVWFLPYLPFSHQFTHLIPS